METKQDNPHAETFPEVIWLNVGDGDAHEVGPYQDLTDLTWCWESISKFDVRYVRSDLSAMSDMLNALEVAERYLDAVCFNTSNPKKRKNYADALSIVRAAIEKGQIK